MLDIGDYHHLQTMPKKKICSYEQLLLHNQYADMEEEIQQLREGAKNHESYLVVRSFFPILFIGKDVFPDNVDIALANPKKKNILTLLQELSGQHDLEKTSLLSHIQTLEREIFCLSSCSLAKEKESLRKELEKTKAKLKDTESKLKSTMQEKTKLEVQYLYLEF